VDPGEQCDDGNTRNGDGCSSSCTKEVAAGPVTIDPNVLDALRIGSNTDVPLSKTTKAEMLRHGMTSVRTTVRLCVSAVGLVTESTMTERTGYTEYDSNLIAATYAWHFQPYRVNGVPTPVCSTVEITYVLK
jgi:TonB family protein